MTHHRMRIQLSLNKIYLPQTTIAWAIPKTLKAIPLFLLLSGSPNLTENSPEFRLLRLPKSTPITPAFSGNGASRRWDFEPFIGSYSRLDSPLQRRIDIPCQAIKWPGKLGTGTDLYLYPSHTGAAGSPSAPFCLSKRAFIGLKFCAP
ncbi:MAG: hypothetical protein ON057_001708 [Glomeribacter sp. 1016415]|nr:hypothetical protein [Glomeribacter sp. 1016415]